MKKLSFYKSSILLFIILLSPSSFASYYGRFTSGAFLSKEVFRTTQVDRYNDVAILSERLFVNFDKIADGNNEFTVDIRDKNNFFDKLNNERLKLIAKNKLQLYQLNLHNSAGSDGIDYSLGRFPLSEAGAIFVDGADLGFKKSVNGFSAKFSLFYGLSPQLLDEASITLNPDSKIYGGYLVIEDKGKDWEDSFFTTTSIVRQEYKKEVDRFYLFNNTNMQSSNGQNFSSIFYLDLVPYISIQNLWATYSLNLQNKFKLRTSASTIDSLHYIRIQDVRETLPSSRYHQGSLSLRSPSAYNETTYEVKLTGGLREVDKKNLVELKFGTFYPKIIKDEISGTLNMGLKKNFVSNDAMIGAGFLHSNKFREISLSQDLILEKREIEGLNYAFVTEGSYTKFFDRSLFGIVSLQNTWDKSVSIFSIFFKLSYRFGEGGQAPIRDGSPPMGQL